MSLNSVLRKRTRNIVGLSSGTSVDGIDTVLVEISGSGYEIKVKVIDFLTFRIPDRIRTSILKNSDTGTAKLSEICRLNVILGKLFADAVKKIRKRNTGKSIDLIGSHGQTIHHLPKKGVFLGYKIKSTLQIGDPSVIANITGITTVGDFRIADCSVDGDGAPLVPYLDYVLFRSARVNRCLLNIGGIANITVIPKSCGKNEVIAFDTGPGNMLIDGLMQRFYRTKYDKDGKIAARGLVNRKLFSYLLKDSFYMQKPPKSTGREHYGMNFLQKIVRLGAGMAKQDIIRTVTEFTAYSIWFNYVKFIRPRAVIDELIASGGGANNPILMNCIKKLMKGSKLLKLDSFGMNADSKEAVLFALLANECVSSNPANMKSVTGSKKDVILGKICPALP